MLLLLLSCDVTTVATTLSCTLSLPALEPASAEPGAEIIATTSPLSTDWDTAVLVGSTRATITGLSRSDCSGCDSCRLDNGCVACGECGSCKEECSICVETVSFQVPALEAGVYPISILNQYGRSEAASLTVTAVDSGLDSGADSTP
jgi:hypothetical protein